MTPDALVLRAFDWLHGHPERSWQEHATTDYLAQQLDALGISYQRLNIPGLVADLPGTDPGAPLVGIRADLDAIWYGDPESGHARHSCGHSGHMAAVLGAAALLKPEPARRPVRLLFQPAEETAEGALAFMERGLLDGVDRLIGVHLRPEEDLVDGLAPSLSTGAAFTVVIDIEGETAHGARPHQGRNPIEAVVAVQHLVAGLRLAPSASWSAKVTHVTMGGGAYNVVPGSARMAVDVRAQENADIRALKTRLCAGLDAVGPLVGMDVAYEVCEEAPASETAPDVEAALAAAITAEAPELLRPRVVTPGADDFCFYTDRTGVRGAMLAVGCRFTPGLHHPEASFDPSVLPTVARVLAAAAREL